MVLVLNEYLGSDKTLSDRVGVAGTGIDLATHILDSTPVGALLNMAVEKIDERGIAQLERTKTIQSIKAKFSGKISRVVAQKMHASTMAKGTKHLANVHSEQNFMDKSKEAFDKHQVGMSHKIKRKLHWGLFLMVVLLRLQSVVFSISVIKHLMRVKAVRKMVIQLEI
ncbi:hypothetical protein ACPSKX_19695 [Moritella viscosa]